MGRVSKWLKSHATGKKKAERETPESGEDGGTGTVNQPRPESPAEGVGPLAIVNNISGGGAGAGASGTDVVFVHGLRGARLKTWSKDGVCWPKDLLQNDLQDVRVITWGYDASVANAFNPASKESIFGHADTLLNDLARLRVGTTRPVVFVCHSLGGLVVKAALIKADNYNNHDRHPSLGAIFARTTGVIFMGTPHRGSSKESYGDLLVKIAKVAFRQPNDQLLHTLRPDSHILEDQREQWTTISSRMKIVCIREELATGIGIIVPEASASYDGFNVRRGAINANHMEMAKFSSKGDPGYERTLGFIVELCNAGQARQQANEFVRKRNDEILELLSFPSINKRELGIEKAYVDTCTWIMDEGPSTGTDDLRTPRFKSWLKNSDSVFWISGKAGCGKSTLMKYVYQHKDTDAALAEWAGSEKLIKAGHFFMERGDDMQKSREGMIRSLLCQILGKRRDLIRFVFPTFFNDALPPFKSINTWENLSIAFDAVLDGLKDSKVCLFIDGLDEYRMVDKKDEYTQEQLDHIFDGAKEDESWGLSDWIIDGHCQIAQFVLRFNNRSNAKICLSSRELGTFEEQFKHLPRLEVHYYTAGSIEKYCEERLAKEAPSLTDRFKFVSSITEKSQGVFLWVHLVVNMLVKGNADGDTLSELLKTLKSLPARLGGKNGLYMLMMQNVKKSHLAEAERLFQLVMFWDSITVQGKMDIITLFLAQEGHLRTDGDGGLRAKKEESAPETWEALRPRWTGLIRRLKSRCGGLLEGAEGVQFMHQTAKEFISRAYLWDLIFPTSNGFAPGPAKHLALLSGLIRGVKCCAEVTSKPQEPLDPEQSPHNSPARYPSAPFKHLGNALDVASQPIFKKADNSIVNDYVQLVDELDTTCESLASLQGAGIAAQTRRNWVEIFLENRTSPTRWRPTSLLELMTGFNAHWYVIPKLVGKGIPQPQLQTLLRAASESFSLVWKGEQFGNVGRPCPEVIKALFAEGANPNSKLDERYDSNPEPNSMGGHVDAVEPITVWTSFLRNLYSKNVLIVEDNMLSVIEHFLCNGADQTARFHREGNELITVAKVIEGFIAESPRNRELKDFPNVASLLQSNDSGVGSVTSTLFDD